MKILVTKRANRDFLTILDYLKHKWDPASVENLKSITNDFFDILESFSEIGSIEPTGKRIFEASN